MSYFLACSLSYIAEFQAKRGPPHPYGTMHEGLVATLLDSCMGLAVQSTLEQGLGQTTVEFKIALLSPITPQTVLMKAEGVVLHRGRRIGTAEGRLIDGQGRLLAHGTATCLIFENRAWRRLPTTKRRAEPLSREQTCCVTEGVIIADHSRPEKQESNSHDISIFLLNHTLIVLEARTRQD